MNRAALYAEKSDLENRGAVYDSTFIVSIFISIASLLTAVSALWLNVQKARDVIGNLLKFIKMSNGK